MKALVYLIIFLTPLLAKAQPKVVVDKAVIKMEKVREGEVVKHTFKISNSGNAPLVLSSYNVGCPCTKVTLPKQPIAPGQTVDVPMEFDSKGKYGFQDRVIVVNTNVPKNPEFILRFKVVVK